MTIFPRDSAFTIYGAWFALGLWYANSYVQILLAFNRCCIQCALVCAFYMGTWVTVHILPLTGVKAREVYFLSPMSYLLDTGVSSLVVWLNEKARTASYKPNGVGTGAAPSEATETLAG
ncbi:unnamed protein product, partial [Mesorhabditis spiculigera]